MCLVVVFNGIFVFLFLSVRSRLPLTVRVPLPRPAVMSPISAVMSLVCAMMSSLCAVVKLLHDFPCAVAVVTNIYIFVAVFVGKSLDCE
jgi:hypothetical protein